MKKPILCDNLIAIKMEKNKLITPSIPKPKMMSCVYLQNMVCRKRASCCYFSQKHLQFFFEKKRLPDIKTKELFTPMFNREKLLNNSVKI